jgi:hypothetical protein
MVTPVKLAQKGKGEFNGSDHGSASNDCDE